jgi:hypothetical protein|tara:strand:+ start:5465 stop:5605 length:141 start_codon:yes stop_codon:yes gene_type:complete
MDTETEIKNKILDLLDKISYKIEQISKISEDIKIQITDRNKDTNKD